jgi:hypothetical protein
MCILFFFLLFILYLIIEEPKRKKERKKIKVNDSLLNWLWIQCHSCRQLISFDDDVDDNVAAAVVVVDEGVKNNWENQYENVHLYSNWLLNLMVLVLLVHYLSSQDHLMNSHHCVKDLYQSFF